MSARAAVERRLLRVAVRLPAAVQRAVFGPPARNDRGDALLPDVHAMCWLEQRVPGAGLASSSPAAARASMLHSLALVQGPALAEVQREERQLGGVPCRLYRGPTPPRAVLVYAHGGGWVAGSVASHDRACQRLARDAHRLVVSVDYRLAPEHPFPAGLDDLLAVLRAVRCDPALAAPERIEVGGDSAGGNLAAAACLALRDAGEPLPVLQLLVYPALDLRCAASSHRTLGRGFLLSEDKIHWYRAQYGAPWQNPLASPLRAPSLAGLPPALVAVAGFDPLRDEGEQYAARLDQAGVRTRQLVEPGLVHGWLNMDGALPSADAAFRRLVEALRADS